MIKLSYATITHPVFQQAFFSLAGQKVSAKAAHDLRVMRNRLNSAITEADSVRLKLVGDYCEKDEEGKFVMQKDEEGKDIPGSIVPIAETKDEFEKKFREYLTTEVEIKGNKINVEDIKDAKISIDEMDTLSAILDLEDED